MDRYDVYGIGNALVDTEYEVTDEFLNLAKLPKGVMTLIGAEDRQRLIHLLEQEHEHQAVKLSGGGSAANTVVAVSQLGGRAFYSCKVANDDTGDLFVRDLKDLGIDTNLSDSREPGVTGECISMVTPDAERTMTTHLGITEHFSIAELQTEVLQSSKILYIEGYLVSSPTGLDAALEAQAIASAAGVKVALTLSDPAMVENFKNAFDTIISRGVDILFCNTDEASLWTSTTTREASVAVIGEACPNFAMTCGSDGAIISDGSEVFHVPGFPTTPVDTTGAGDNFAGAFLAKLCQGLNHQEAATFANQSASMLVANFGARLTMDMVTNLLAN
jgi:sugar/nucleoside kinase (ribokinase family)